MPEVGEHNLLHITVASAWTTPCLQCNEQLDFSALKKCTHLDTRAILRVHNSNVVDIDVFDDIFHTVVFSQRANGDTVLHTVLV